MKTLFTKNPGLKIISVVAAFVLWLVVVNVDDPVISKTYTGIAVEITNEDVLAQQGKCYDILDDSATINVVVTAHRSVLDGMSRDYIKATADLKQLTSIDTVPIEVRSTRFADRIDSVTTRDSSIKLRIENLVRKEVTVATGYEGEPAEGYILSGVENPLSSVIVDGPESVVSRIAKVMATADITGVNNDLTVTEPLHAYDSDNELIDDPRITLSRTVTEIKYIIYATKTIPISSGYSGTPASGYGIEGPVITEPSSVVIAGRGENFDDMEVVYISPDKVLIEGASSTVQTTVSVADALPTGVIFADADFDPNVTVTINIAENQRKVIEVPLSNVTVENVPEGYTANIADIGGSFPVEIQGIGDAYDRYSGDLAIGRIDAAALVSRSGVLPGQEGAPVATGECDGIVEFDFPSGVSTVNPVTLMVVVDYVGTRTEEEPPVVILDE